MRSRKTSEDICADPRRRSEIREGDTIPIVGSYQYDAITTGPRVQRYWHGLKLYYIRRFCLPEAHEHVLDIGCGSGVVSDFLAGHAGHVTAIDANSSAIQFARKTFHRPNLEFIQTTVEGLDFREETFGEIYCLELIEHIHEHQTAALLAKSRLLLAEGGRLFVTTPNYRGLWPLLEWFMDKTGAAPQMADEQHVAHYNRRKLRNMLETAGFQVVQLRTFSTFAPFLAFWLRLADFANAIECRLNLPFGNIIMVVAEKVA
jgi:2-polyprenyl-3-methyl-5-hydroxy-6-metoxy-1,4-benzoquinol methylase